MKCDICETTVKVYSFYKHHICEQCKGCLKMIPRYDDKYLNSVIDEILSNASRKGKTPKETLRKRLDEIKKDVEQGINILT